MATSSEEISKYNANSQGKTDSNLANDAEHLGGILAEDFATKDYVHRYHDNKETELKKYVDEQDASNLEKAKAYADNLVGNQDFSDFAKTTDVQALDTKLSKKIEDCGTQCAANLKQVVDDVNSNFDDVGKSIEKLNQGQNDLFQSVSSGKAKIAGAITDKGVTTSATDSFDTMASNIRSIDTSGGDANTVNTSDATASSYDIALGKTAYVRGSKITGTHIDVNLDTSDATATPHDIVSGKTAYVNGQKIEGDLNVSGLQYNYDVESVEKIYGDELQSYELEQYTNNIFNDSCSGDIIFYDDEPIGSIYIKDSFLKIQLKNNPDVEYSLKDDLGLDCTVDTEVLTPVKISRFNIISKIGYVVIGVYENDTHNIHIYVFKAVLELGGSHGKYSITIDKESMLTTSTSSTQGMIQDFRNDCNIFFLPHESHLFGVLHRESPRISWITSWYYYLDIYTIKDEDSGHLGSPVLDLCNGFGSYKFEAANVNYFPMEVKVLNNGKVICYHCGGQSVSSQYAETFIKIINDNTYETVGEFELNGEWLILSYDCTLAYDLKDSILYTIEIDYEAGNITQNKIKDMSSLITPNNQYGETILDGFRVNDDVSALFLCEKVCIGTGLTEGEPSRIQRTKVYSIDFTTEEVFILIQTYDNFEAQNQLSDGNSFFCREYEIANIENNKINTYDCNKLLYPVFSKNQVLGLRYQGEIYYKNSNLMLNALPQDVIKGRTFMGRNGRPEIGTLEV